MSDNLKNKLAALAAACLLIALTAAGIRRYFYILDAYYYTAEFHVIFPSGCTVCPSGCNGGIITDNVLPLKTTVNYYKVDWDKMPPVGSKVEVTLKSIYGPYPLSATKA